MGFVMRLILDALKFSVPNSLYERMLQCWSGFRERCSDCYWRILRQCLVFFEGDVSNNLESSQHQQQQHDHDQQHQNNQQQQNHNNGGSSSNKKNTSLQLLLNHPDYYYKDVIKYWPIPPGLTLLTLVTGLAFVIHPDGLTWIIVGKLL